VKFFETIRARLALSITAALVLVLGGAAFLSYELIDSRLLERTDASLRADVAWLRERLSRDAEWDPAVREFNARLGIGRQSTMLQIVTRSRDVLYRSPSLRGAGMPTSEAATVSTMPIAGEPTRVAMWATEVYYISVGTPLTDEAAALGAIQTVFVVAIPAAILVALVIGLGISRRAFRPIDRTVRAAERITSRNLHERLPSAGVDDEVGRLVLTLNAMIARLDESFSRISQFTADAAHELRTPLTILRGELEVALRGPGVPAAEREVFESALEEVERLTAIVGSLLTLARSDAGAPVTRERVALGEILEDVRQTAQQLAASKGITVRVAIDEPLVVDGDPRQLEQVALNLATNAVKYTSAGEITIRLQRAGPWARITVHDTGIGIPPEELPHVFDRFFRADRARSRDGALGAGVGLGLAIAKTIVVAHGGTIAVKSTPGAGSTFTVDLPISPGR
jgi:heavy metal sensor kinase